MCGSTAALREIVTEAWQRRDRFDLREAGYGRIHWGYLTDVVKDPFSYYFFLAGMVSLTSARSIVEIGPHRGGSARALCAGLAEHSNSRVLTYVSSEGARAFSVRIESRDSTGGFNERVYRD
jgi:hypothetical protein